MKDEKKTKKGFFSLIRESLSKTGGCCGAGQTCGAPPPTTEKASAKETTQPVETKQK